IRRQAGFQAAIGEGLSTHAPVTLYGEFERPFYPATGGPPMSYYVKKYEREGDPEHAQIKFAVEGIFNHPMGHSQLVPFETPVSHAALMKSFDRTMTVAILLRDAAVGRVGPNTFEYELAAEDRPRLLDAMRTSAQLMLAAGAQRVFSSDVQPWFI